jgi:hypothetical protein
MKNRNNQLIAALFVVALMIAPLVQAAQQLEGGPTHSLANSINPEGENLPVITIYSTDNVTRGKIGTFVLNMKPALAFGGMYVKFSVSGTAIPGIDYVALVSPVYIGQSGYAVIQVQTLPDPRGSSSSQAYSVKIALEPAAGYFVGQPSSATMWIKP